jgi:hypothetical protein
MNFEFKKQDAQFYKEAFKSQDHAQCKKGDKHHIDYKKILKDLGDEIYKQETRRCPKTDKRLRHDPFPNERL